MSVLRKFIDIGANLTDPMYMGIYNGTKKHDNDLEHVLNRSWKAGLNKIIVTGGNFEESKKALELAKTDEKLFSTVGCHPTRCSEFESSPTDYLDNLKNIIREGGNKVVAIGECGLDYDRLQFCSKDVQKRYFELQLELVNDFALPLFLHCRNAATDLIEILKKSDNLKGVIHSFDGTLEEAQQFLNMNFYIGLNGCSLKTKENLEVIPQIPNDRILIETDCPWCEVRPSHAGFALINKEHFFAPTVKKEKWNPQSMIKSRNEPINIRHVLDIIASVKKADPDALSKMFYENSQRLFFNK